MNKLLKVAVVLFVIFLIYTAPSTAAAATEDGLGFLGDFAASAADFLGQIVG